MISLELIINIIAVVIMAFVIGAIWFIMPPDFSNGV